MIDISSQSCKFVRSLKRHGSPLYRRLIPLVLYRYYTLHFLFSLSYLQEFLKDIIKRGFFSEKHLYEKGTRNRTLDSISKPFVDRARWHRPFGYSCLPDCLACDRSVGHALPEENFFFPLSLSLSLSLSRARSWII
jgi:hypothetical protein